MISSPRISRARIALRIVRELELPPEQWTVVRTFVRKLKQALHAGDEAGLRRALAELERIGATRSAWTGEVDDGDHIGPSPDRAASDLLTELDDADRELDVAAAEIRRTPHIDLDATGPLPVGARFIASVYLDTTPSGPGETAEAFLVRDEPEHLTELTVEVWLTATAHFVIESPATATVIVRPRESRSTTARFEVSVRRDVPAEAGTPALRAIFDHNLRAGGTVRRTVPLTSGGGSPSAVTGDRPECRGRFTVHGRAATPDLEVTITRATEGSARYRVRIRSRLLDGIRLEDDWILPEGSEAFVKRIMADFVDRTATPLARRRSLEGAGMMFFDAAPQGFRELYWRMVDAGTLPRSLYLVSDERAVPWELMIPRRRLPDGTTQTMSPLGVSCTIGRWHHEEFTSPDQRIELYDSLVLAPDYPLPHKLRHAAAERDLLLRRFQGRSVPDTFDELDEFYASNSASILHFVCHGRDETLQSLLLRDGQVLSAQQVESGGLGDACRAARPLVFLNACEVGRPSAALASVGGFPAAFIRCDAGGVVAPLWAVDDGVAHQVTTAFYGAIAAQPTRAFADILREVRARAYTVDGADSFAAYCYYGDPLTAAVRA
jgi:hypothetical protein